MNYSCAFTIMRQQFSEQGSTISAYGDTNTLLRNTTPNLYVYVNPGSGPDPYSGPIPDSGLICQKGQVKKFKGQIYVIYVISAVY